MGASTFGQALHPVHSREVRGSSRSPDPKAGTGSEISGLLFKTTVLSGPGMARLPAGKSSLLVNEASKPTLGQHVDVLTPHQVQSVLEVKGHHWLTGGRLTRYQALLVDTPAITLKVCQTLNLATLLPTVQSGDLVHQCIETIEQTCSSRSDLLDEPLDSPEVEWFTDGSSFVETGT